MGKRGNFAIFNCSLMAIFVVLATSASFAALRITNSGKPKNSPFNQGIPQVGTVNSIYQTTTQNTVTTASDTPDVDMSRCQTIYPNGKFEYNTPTIGSSVGGTKTCTAVVEMRTKTKNGATIVLARANLAAGDYAKCNISDFPTSGYTAEAGTIEFPADNPPTMEDVIKIMNQEQRQNAGFKILAGALVGGLGGNLSGANDIGKDNMFGTDKGKLKGTAIGALGGAAVGAGGAFGGKVGGDIILSTGVNAAAGSVVGNVMATGDDILKVTDCSLPNGVETKCIWGNIELGETLSTDGDEKKVSYYDPINAVAYECEYSKENENSKNPEDYDCTNVTLINIKITNGNSEFDIETKTAADIKQWVDGANGDVYYAHKKEGTNEIYFETDSNGAESIHRFFKVVSATKTTNAIPALVEFNSNKSGKGSYAFGIKTSEWSKYKIDNASAVIYRRGANATGQNLTTEEIKKAWNDEGPVKDHLTLDSNVFRPVKLSPEDGGIIDFGNKARMKSTLSGAGVGGAMGAFSAYEGAQKEIQMRYVTELDAYNNSLISIWCATGTQVLGSYNGEIHIPSMQ